MLVGWSCHDKIEVLTGFDFLLVTCKLRRKGGGKDKKRRRKGQEKEEERRRKGQEKEEERGSKLKG